MASHEYESNFGLDSLERDIGVNTGKSAFGKPVAIKAGVETSAEGKLKLEQFEYNSLDTSAVVVCFGNGNTGV